MISQEFLEMLRRQFDGAVTKVTDKGARKEVKIYDLDENGNVESIVISKDFEIFPPVNMHLKVSANLTITNRHSSTP